jgi:hypothetical protein
MVTSPTAPIGLLDNGGQRVVLGAFHMNPPNVVSRDGALQGEDLGCPVTTASPMKSSP